MNPQYNQQFSAWHSPFAKDITGSDSNSVCICVCLCVWVVLSVGTFTLYFRAWSLELPVSIFEHTSQSILFSIQLLYYSATAIIRIMFFSLVNSILDSRKAYRTTTYHLLAWFSPLLQHRFYPMKWRIHDKAWTSRVIPFRNS